MISSPLTEIDVVSTEIARVGQQTRRFAQLALCLLQSCHRRFYLLFVVGLLREVVLHYQMRVDIYRRLRL